jgi:hypothetical protein
MKSFYIINSRVVPAIGNPINGAAPKQPARRERLRYRDMIWAFHSESQDLLLKASTAACNGKMTWSDARALGIAIWLNSGDLLVSDTSTTSNSPIYYFPVENPIRGYRTE